MSDCQNGPVHHLTGGGNLAQRQRLLVLGMVARQHRGRRQAGVGHHDIDRPADGAAHPFDRVTGGEATHAAALGQQVGDKNYRALHRAQAIGNPVHQQRRHQAGEEAAGTDDDRIERANRIVDRGMDVRVGFEPDTGDPVAALVPFVHLHFAARDRPVGVLGAQRGPLDAHRPDAAAAAEQRPEPIDGGQEVAAVLLHHRQQEVAAGVPAQPFVLERGQPSQQHAARLALVAGQGERTAQHVARRQHAKFVAQLPGTAARVEHRHDGVDLEPGGCA
jgi:hypothetical protein